MEIKRAILATSIVWVLGVSAYILSHFVKIMDNPELQANVVLTLALIPSAILGTKFYYKNGAHTNGFKLGVFMFLITIGLDALITVPVFIIPAGGDHLSFFSDPGFWIIGLVYILVVILYTGIRSKMRTSKL
ncbi:DUF5367 family protein [uncultured Eudoraea sp.]|jgi:hypothetical protein|uniref:DUF5367 family protein n=1 Tax=uncultured Eudoraea sp. TaxID=1035614 RepID=UPI0026241163|nr:DUF5367 family protein [uncultured Eudoraea sp.]